MSRSKRFLQGVGVNYVSQALIALLSLWLTPFFLKHLGKEQYGLWLVGLGILTYLLLLDLGVTALLPREIAYAIGRHTAFEDTKNENAVLSVATQLVLLQTPIVGIVAFLIWVFLPPSWQPLRGPLGLVFIFLVITYPLRIFQNVLQGLQDFGFLGLLFTVAWLIGSATSVVMILTGHGLNSLAIGWGATQCVLLPGCLLRLKSKFKSFSIIGIRRFSRIKIIAYLRKSLWMSVSQVSQVLLNGTEVILIGKLLGPQAVVIYVCSSKLVTLLSNQTSVITQSAAPALSEMKVSEPRDRLIQASAALNQLVLTVSGGIFCLILAINEGFVKLWVGAELFGGIQLTVLILLNMLLRHWELTLCYNVFTFGHERALALTGIVDGLISIGAMAFLLPRFGIVGVPIGALLGVTLIGLPVMLTILALELDVSVTELIRKIVPWFVQVIALGIILCLILYKWVPHTVFAVAAFACGTLAVYLLMVAPIVFRSNLGTYVLPRLDLLKAKFLTLIKQ